MTWTLCCRTAATATTGSCAPTTARQTGSPRNTGRAYFNRDSGTGIDKFLEDWLPSYKATRKDGLYCLITCNHDTIRPAANLTADELKLAYAVLFTMPGAPFLYYGDEIGMRYRKLPTKEGGYYRTGSRTPMQWAPGENLGFSDAAPEALYLPVDPSPDAPTVAAPAGGPGQPVAYGAELAVVPPCAPGPGCRRALQGAVCPKAQGDFRPFAWRRGSLVCAVNPAGAQAELPLKLEDGVRPLFVIGMADVRGGKLVLGAQSFAILA